MPRRARDGQDSGGPRRGGRRTASAGLLVAVGTGVGNVLAYGFNLVLSRGLGPGGYAELGTLLSVFLIGTVPGLAVQAINARRLAVLADAPQPARAALVRGLRRRGLAVAAGVAAVFVALAPAIAALLPSVTVGGVGVDGGVAGGEHGVRVVLGDRAGDVAVHDDDGAVPGRAGVAAGDRGGGGFGAGVADDGDGGADGGLGVRGGGRAVVAAGGGGGGRGRGGCGTGSGGTAGC